MTELILEGLTKKYGAFKAVDNISLTLRDGEFLSLLGPSGCGKTTTLRMIAGFITPTDGRIILDGQVISSPQGSLPPEKRGMAMIFQSYAIWPNKTVSGNVSFGLRMQRLPTAEVRSRTEHILDVVQLKHLSERYPSELSGGQQQRVALARAIAVQPKVMLMDEPLSNLDANLREEMRTEIKRLHDEFGVTTVYVTHDQSEAMAISDRIAVINAGRIEQIDTPYALYARPKTRFAAEFIGRTNLIQGRRSASTLEFEGFSVPSSAGVDGPLLVSIRPQCLKLRPRNGLIVEEESGNVHLNARVVERIFLGEKWDYSLKVENGPMLRAATPPEQVFEQGAEIQIIISNERIIPIEAETEL